MAHTETAQAAPAVAPGEVTIGLVVGINAQGQPIVEYAQSPLSQPVPALSTLGITQQHIGRQVALLFANGNPKNPVIMGLIHSPLHELMADFEVAPTEAAPTTVIGHETMRQPMAVEKGMTVNGERLVLEGKEEIVLKCGDASITLTKAGKILIRGKYVLTRSEGVNRMMGGSVQVN